MEHLFSSGPSTSGGILQWHEAEGEMRTNIIRARPALYEDDDAAKASELDFGALVKKVRDHRQ